MQERSGSGLKRWPRILRKLVYSDEDLAEFVERVRNAYPRSTILLFGSRARRDHLPYSDYDVAVIVEEARNKVRMAEEISILKPERLPLDLVILEPSDLSDPLVAKMLRNCKILYDGLSLETELLALGCKQRMQE